MNPGSSSVTMNYVCFLTEPMLGMSEVDVISLTPMNIATLQTWLDLITILDPIFSSVKLYYP